MRIKILIAVTAGLISTTATQAQQIFKITQFLQHNFFYNPAASGVDEKSSFGAMYRSMWAGIDGGPKTTVLFFDKKLEKHKVGFSTVFYSNKTGPTSRTGGNLNLAYIVKLKDDRALHFGLGAHLLQFSVDKNKIASAIANDPLLASASNTFKGDANAGVYFTSSKFNIGVSAMQLVQPKLNMIKGTSGEDNQGKLYRHYYVVSNYNIQVDEDNVLTPNVLVKYQPNAPVDIEAGARLLYQNFLWVGANYHYKQEFSIYAGLKIDEKMSIGYAYDRYNAPVDIFNGGNGGHEFALRFFLK